MELVCQMLVLFRKRICLPHAEVMIHQVLGETRGQETDIQIEARHMARMKKTLTEIIAQNCGKSYETVYADCERNNWMSAEEAKEYGLIDSVIYRR